jgi:hypothetical protein
MTIKFYELGDGVLILGAANDVTAQVTECKIAASESVKTVDAIEVLSGEEIPETSKASVSRTLTGTFVQDIEADGLVDWSEDNETTEQDFIFCPAETPGRARKGVLYPVGIDFGGSVGPGAATSAFTWRIKGKPVKGDYADDTFTPDA